MLDVKNIMMSMSQLNHKTPWIYMSNSVLCRFMVNFAVSTHSQQT